MSNLNNFSKFSTAKNFKFICEGPLNKTEIELHIPDFSQNEYNVSGDWGPNYEISLNAQAPLQVRYKDLNSQHEEAYSLEQRIFRMNSPMLHKVRSEFPFVIELSDERKGLNYQLYLNNETELGKVEVLRSNDSVALFNEVIA